MDTVSPMKRANSQSQRDTDKSLRDYADRRYDRNDREWLSFRATRTTGNASRIFSPVSGFKHFPRNGIQSDLFYSLERKRDTIDVELNVPLDRHIALACARVLKCEETFDRELEGQRVLTLGALAKRRQSGGEIGHAAFDCVTARSLWNRSTLRSLSINRLYCHYVGYSHHIVTEKTFGTHIRKNLAWVRDGMRLPFEVERPLGLFSDLPERMLEDLRTRRKHLSLQAYAAWFEETQKLPVGIGLRVLKILVWRHDVEVEMDHAELADSSTVSLTLRSPSSHKDSIMSP